MTHLTVDEMINFVSFDRVNEDSLAIAVKVNSHIRGCEECLDKLRAFQTVHDELVKLGKYGNFRMNLREKAKKDGLLDADL